MRSSDSDLSLLPSAHRTYQFFSTKKTNKSNNELNLGWSFDVLISLSVHISSLILLDEFSPFSWKNKEHLKRASFRQNLKMPQTSFSVNSDDHLTKAKVSVFCH